MNENAPTTAEPAESANGIPPRKHRNPFKFPRSWREVRALGWKMIVAFVLFYLVRDSILYILLPYLAYKGIFD